MKYKVGDNVRVRKDLVVNKPYGRYSFVRDMHKYIGKEVTIKTATNGTYVIEQEENDKYQWFWSDEMFEDGVTIMTLDDLKTGMVVEFADGRRYIVLRECKTINGQEDVMIDSYGCWVSFDDFENDLKCKHDDMLNIVKVFVKQGYGDMLNLHKHLKVIWERKEAKKMTVAEISKALGYEVEVVAG